MNPIKTILVDDEPRALTSMKKLLQLSCDNVEVVACCENVTDAKEIINRLQPQLVFLDIAMPEKNGFDLLRSLDRTDFEIIFVTAHNNYMVQAFQFSAVDYLLKPVENELLAEAVKRAEKRIAAKTETRHIETFLYNLQKTQSPQQMKLCIPSLKGFQVMELKDILFCEASGSYSNFHFTNHPLICSARPIYEYEKILADSGFIRIHKSYMVNLLHIKEYIRGEGGMVILSNNREIEVSRRRKDLFISRMKEFYKF